MNHEERVARLLRARTFLFVPGDRPDRIAKAMQSSADAVIIDLEDAVRPESKATARELLVSPVQQFRSDSGPLVLIRTNDWKSPEFSIDIALAFDIQVDAIMVPKFVPGADAIAIDETLTKVETSAEREEKLSLIGLIESTAGVLNLLSSQVIPDRFKRLAFGAADLYADLGVTYSSSGPNTDLAMAVLVVASAHQNLGAPIDSPHFTVDDLVGLKERASFAHAMGFGAKLCIHPNQLATVAEIFTVSAQEKDWATRVIQRWQKRDESAGALLIDGALVDEAMVKQARRILGTLN